MQKQAGSRSYDRSHSYDIQSHHDDHRDEDHRNEVRRNEVRRYDIRRYYDRNTRWMRLFGQGRGQAIIHRPVWLEQGLSHTGR